MKSLFTRTALSVALCFAGLNQAAAQASAAADYFFTPKSGSFTYLSGGTEVTDVEVDDGLSSSIPIGFTFTYCGTDYTDVYASSNGWISFGSSPYIYAYPGSTSYLATGSSAGIGPAAMPLWDDASGAGGTATYLTEGTAPNRVFTIEFRNWKWDYSVSDPVLSFQVKLFEGTNIIQYIYEDEGGSPFWDYSAGATIGIGGGTSSDYLVIDDATASPTASSSTFTYSITNKPASGQIYEFSPYPACDGTPDAFTPLGPVTKVCPGIDFTLTENTTDIRTGKTYQWRSRPSGSGAFTDIPGATNSALTTNITANTDYELYITCTESGMGATTTTKTVEVLQPSPVTASGPATFCSNQSLTLSTTGVAGYTYQWARVGSGLITGATTTSYAPLTSGRYLLMTYTSSCTAGLASTDTVDVTVLPAPEASVSPEPSVTICNGETTVLTGSGTGDYQWLNSTGAIAGATGTTLATGVAEYYQLEITNTANGCKDTSAITEIISTPAPTVSISPVDSVRVCTGLSATINSITTGSGLSFQWYDASGALTGETAPTLVSPDAGLYTLVVTAGSCTDTSNTTEIKLLPLPDATLTSVGTTKVVCPMGSDLVIEAPGTAGYTYQWKNGGTVLAGATGQSYKITVPGDYSVEVTDAFGCIQNSATYTATGTPAATPRISPSDLYFCEGGNLMLYANTDKYYTGFQWIKDGVILTDDTLDHYTSSVSGTYELQITDSFNCVTRSAPALVTVNPAPKKPEINLVGTQLVTGLYTTYQWYRNGKEISGATGRRYNLVFDGYYTVQVTNAYGCYNLSDSFLYQADEGTGISTASTAPIRIYPNPTTGKIYLEYSGSLRVSITDMQGKLVMPEQEAHTVDLSQWPDGLYFLTIKDDHAALLHTEKITKQSR